MNNNCFQGFLSNCTAKNNELLLKEARLSETDEREKEISDRALKLTLKTLLLTLYLLLFFCAFVSVEALTVLYFLIAEFFLCYLLYRKYYSTKL